MVSYTTQKPNVSREAEMSALRRALAVERKGYYSDLQGKRTTFSRFVRQTAEKLARRYPMELVWATIRGLFRDYPNLDVGTRISIVKRAEELMEPLWNEHSKGGALISPLRNEAPSSPFGKVVSEGRKHTSSQNNMNGPMNGDMHGNTNGNTNGPNNTTKPSSTSNISSVKDASTRELAPIAANPHKNSQKSEKVSTGSEALASHEFKDINLIPVRYVKGVGPKAEVILNRLNIFTVSDLIRHYPRRHLDFQNRLFIRQLKPGMEVTVFGTIKSVGAFQSKRGNVSILTVTINDETGVILVTRFVGGKSNKYLLERYKSQYPKGSQVIASGFVERDQFTGRLSLKNAELEILAQSGQVDVQAGGGEQDYKDDSTHLHTGRLVPVYPLTDGLSLRHLRNIIFHALESFGHLIEETIPSHVRENLQLQTLSDAFRFIHFPTDLETNEEARRRLVFEELFAIQLQLAIRRHRFESDQGALVLAESADGLVQKLLSSLPFELTDAQKRVFSEIRKDLAASKPMHRLVQGDVGSGKTIVALMAFLVAIEHGFQGVMMAPTEILAEQHYRQFQRLITPLGLKCCLVLGKQGQKERKAIRQDLLSGQVHIAVGTHALLVDGVDFKNLGLIVVDEQHRFGVKQRALLKLKSQSPELLTMTATPIPRTMALTIHGDLDISEIDELPPGRKPIETRLFRQSQRKQIIASIEEQIIRGRQVYIVFPLIDESETLSAKAATKEFENLRQQDFQHRRLGLMHGKLAAHEKDEVMERFRKHELDILVSTTVVEVGVDVPNATVMVIENADRFGLAQLHQLRGRVGRSSEQSFCYLVSDSRSETTMNRLSIMTETNDGFVIAEKDLEIRGPGEFLGFKQSGLPDLVLTDLVKDAKILEQARNTAIALIKEDSELQKYPVLKMMLKKLEKSVESDIVRAG